MSKYEVSGYAPARGRTLVALADSRAAAEVAVSRLEQAGALAVEIVRLRRHPGEWRHVGADRAFAL